MQTISKSLEGKLNWILFGFKGVGKTYLGKRLAERLGYLFIDTDAFVEEREGLSCRELTLEKGVEYFRAAEKEVIHQLGGKGQIISLGGGAVLDPDNRDYLQAIGKMIYLIAPLSLIEKRLLSPPLPSFIDEADPKGSLHQIYREREKLYEQIPAIRVLLSQARPVEALAELYSLVQDNS